MSVCLFSPIKITNLRPEYQHKLMRPEPQTSMQTSRLYDTLNHCYTQDHRSVSNRAHNRFQLKLLKAQEEYDLLCVSTYQDLYLN